MSNNTIIAIIATLIIAGGGGYLIGKSATSGVVNTKEADESISMMKEQSVSIQKMGEMMTSGGLMMQSLGKKYNDEEAVAVGKDLEMVGEKYVKENAKASTGSDSMRQVMGN